MKIGDMAEMALRNLREAKLRNALTTLGIAVGVASLVAMVSLGVGLQQLASKRLSRSGLFDTVLVTSRANLRAFGPTSTANRQGPATPLDDDARHAFEKRFHLKGRERRMPGGIHFVRDEFAALDIAQMAGETKLGSLDGIAEIGHSVLLVVPALHSLLNFVAPEGRLGMRAKPFRTRPVAGLAAPVERGRDSLGAAPGGPLGPPRTWPAAAGPRPRTPAGSGTDRGGRCGLGAG